MKASLFIPCLTDHFHPQAGEDAAWVLDRAGVEVDYPAGQTCCGQPAFKLGRREESKAMARHFLEVFASSESIVCLSGSCVHMVRKYYPRLFAGEPVWLERAQEAAARIHEFSQFLAGPLGITGLGARLAGKAVYHPSCQVARALGVEEEPLALLRAVDGLELLDLPGAEQCCGFGGAFSLEFPEVSEKITQAKAQAVEATGADYLISAEISCLMNIGGFLWRSGSRVKPLHIATVLAARGRV